MVNLSTNLTFYNKNINYNLKSVSTNDSVSMILGYGVDKDGFFTSEFNEKAGIPKDYKIYAKGVLNLVDKITSKNSAIRAFESIDIAKSFNRAYQLFSQLTPTTNDKFNQEYLENFPQFFSYDEKSLKITQIHTKDEYLSIANSRNEQSAYNNIKTAISFKNYNAKGTDFISRGDILNLDFDIGTNAYKNADGSISKGGVLMAFLANSDANLLRGETTIAGKLAGLDDNFSEAQQKELNAFLQDNTIIYGSHPDNPGLDILARFKLKSSNLSVDEFKQEWLKLKAEGERANLANNTTQRLENQPSQENNSKKTFTPIKREVKSETYKADDNSFLKKLLENKFSELDQLEILFGIDTNKLSENDYKKLISTITLGNIGKNKVDIKA